MEWMQFECSPLLAYNPKYLELISRQKLHPESI